MQVMRTLTKILGVLCILSCLMHSCKPTTPKKETSIAQEKADPEKLNINEFQAQLEATPNAQLVDVRTPEEYKEGHLKGAVNMNYQGNQFVDEVATLDKSKPVFVYCHSGGRSKEACRFMSNQGFKKIYDMEDGMSAWLHYNKPVEK
jgi:thioredoxin 1